MVNHPELLEEFEDELWVLIKEKRDKGLEYKRMMWLLLNACVDLLSKMEAEEYLEEGE